MEKREYICQRDEHIGDKHAYFGAFEPMQELVRCKDCRKNCTDNCLLYWNDINTPDNWYCADGERKPK